MFIKPSAPWVYLLWSKPHLSAEHEIVLAKMTRRVGIFAMLRIYWQMFPHEREVRTLYFELERAWMFFAKNYPPFLCLAGYYLGLSDCDMIALAWGVTFVYGNVREIAWLLSLLYRWPPMAKN